MAPTPLIESELPLAAAPMAGGPTTVALAQAVQGAGAFPFLAGGYQSAEALSGQIAALRDEDSSFGVNLFVPSSDPVDPAEFAAYAGELAPEAQACGVHLPSSPVTDDDRWAEKIALLRADPVPVASFTFGLPTVADIRALQRVGSRVLATVTTGAEARAAEKAGVDALIVQGPRAGGHSATFDPRRTIAARATADVVREVAASARLPIAAAGGVAGPDDVHALIAAGAASVLVGTLLLATDESGASDTHKNALADPAFTETVLTHAFTGRPARALRNGFIDRHDAHAPFGYPALHHLTRPIRQAAATSGDTDRLHLWAGTGYRSARRGPAADVIRQLASALQ